MATDVLQPPDSRLVVIVNPNSTHAERVRRDVTGPMHDAGWRFPILTTMPPDGDNNLDLIRYFVKPGDTIAVAGGDGGANGVGEALAGLDASTRQQIKTIFLPCGNANDIARSTIGTDILRNGRILHAIAHGQARPLGMIKVQDSEGEDKRGIGYGGFGGITAEAAQRIGRHQHRKLKDNLRVPDIILDSLVVMDTMNNSERTRHYLDGQAIETHDVVFNSIRSMSRVLRIDVDTWAPEMTLNILDKRWLVGDFALRNAMGMLPGHNGIRGERIQRAVLTLLQSSLVQLDGEVFKMPEGDTTITYEPNMLQVIGRDNSRREAA